MRKSVVCGAIAAAVVGVVCSHSSAQLKAFGDAEGFGALATGGRNGTIYHVTNLNDSGAGSLRDAVSKSNRIVVFDVGGVITINSRLPVADNITIAGQTAPGGIAIFGDGVSLSGSSNIILRHITMRQGIDSNQTTKALNITDGSNMIIDHASIGWSRYDNFGITDNSSNITIQNSLTHEAIDNQRAGGFVDSSRGITLARNLFVNNQTRNPKGKGDLQFINNVVYNWRYEGYIGGDSAAPWHQDLINNYFISGKATSGPVVENMNANDRIYNAGNMYDADKVDTGNDQLPEGSLLGNSAFSNEGATIMAQAYNKPTVAVSTFSALDAYRYILSQAGNTLFRDSADLRQFTHLLSLGTQGYVPANEGQVGGMPVWTGLAKPTDTDNDAIPDSWEVAHGLNPNVADSLKTNSLGYRMLEQYINELGDTAANRTWTAGSGNWATTGTWAGGVAPAILDNVYLRGTGSASGNVTVAGGTAQVLRIFAGGNSPAAGESITVPTGAKLQVTDTLHLGYENNATLNITGGTVEAYNIIAGNTVYSPSSANYNGTINLSGGTLAVAQIARGVGAPGSWSGGGTVNWSGGTIKAVGNLNIGISLAMSGTGAVLDSNGFDGQVSGAISGSGTLTKTGLGTVTFTRTNSLSGPLVINAGKALMNGSANNSTVAVKSAATFGGNGSVGGLVAESGSILAPGTSIESLDVTGNATLDGILQIELNGAGTGSTDLLRVGGTLDLTGSRVDFSLVTGGSAVNDPAYIFATYATRLGTFSIVNGLPTGYMIHYAYNDGTTSNNIALVPIPEPTTLTTLALTSLALLRRRRET